MPLVKCGSMLWCHSESIACYSIFFGTSVTSKQPSVTYSNSSNEGKLHSNVLWPKILSPTTILPTYRQCKFKKDWFWVLCRRLFQVKKVQMFVCFQTANQRELACSDQSIMHTTISPCYISRISMTTTWVRKSTFFWTKVLNTSAGIRCVAILRKLLITCTTTCVFSPSWWTKWEL